MENNIIKFLKSKDYTAIRDIGQGGTGKTRQELWRKDRAARCDRQCRAGGLKNTAHEKIFIGKPGTFDLGKLKQSISKLMNISTNDDMGQLRNTLKHIVPTYKESAENKEVLNDEWEKMCNEHPGSKRNRYKRKE